MSAKHIPGLLRVAENLLNKPPFVIVDDKKAPGPLGIADVSTKETALLFAAAPELLAIAKELHGWDDPLHLNAMPDCPACRTIAKAEGRV
jgi:hypothetical protein